MKKILFFTVLLTLVFLLPGFSYAAGQTATLTINITPQEAIDAGCGAVVAGIRYSGASSQLTIRADSPFSVDTDFACGYKGSASGQCSGLSSPGASYTCTITYAQRNSVNTVSDTSKLLITNVAKKITDFVWKVFALFALVLFVIAGMLFLMSRGDPDKVKTARTAFVWGIVGIVLALLAYSIVRILMFFLGA